MSTCDLSCSVLPRPCRCVVGVPKKVSAAVHGPEELVLASMRALTVMLLTLGPMRQRECTEPLMLAPVSPCVVASSTTEPVPPNVSVARVNTVPNPVIVVDPVYWIVVAPSAAHTNRSVPVGSEPALLFIFSPNGTVVLLLMPMYRLENAPAVPVQV